MEVALKVPRLSFSAFTKTSRKLWYLVKENHVWSLSVLGRTSTNPVQKTQASFISESNAGTAQGEKAATTFQGQKRWYASTSDIAASWLSSKTLKNCSVSIASGPSCTAPMYCIAAGPRQSASVFLNSRVGKKSLGQCNGSFLLSGIDGKKILDPENSLKTWIRPKAFHSFASGKSNRVLQTGARATLDVSILNHFGRSPNSALGFHVTKKTLESVSSS